MRRLILGVICAIMLSCGTGQTATADLFSNFQSTSYSSYYAPYYRTSYYRPVFGYRTYYAPVYRYGVRAYYSPTCSPCGSSCSPCSPCGVSCGVGCSPCQSCGIAGNCPGGNCAVNSATPTPADDNWKPTPADGGPPPTYKEGEGAPGPPQESNTPPEANEGREAPGDGATDENVESLKPATDVPQRKAAPIKEPAEGDEKDKKADEAAEEKTDEKSTPVKKEELSFPSLNVDNKITWRSRPIRKRLTIRSRFPTPSIARNRVNPNDKWAPVPTTTTKLVSK
ncbi:MAG: hypothetical protein HON53_07660 [Planctomycetaceae bacterium]|jgi:hypothetical protein|nr:hypothetical protein [Planctomycetaceae bacterium]MBT6157329.1 hypothetical protein [Planctomycetaceae bacterium]MBT6487790.1 hypothetical protein [Planctomycetaceae bacterium]MBT6494562.1 hypothetical protein [Planctomycetaceae bacterium]